jgi:hypothetical protein
MKRIFIIGIAVIFSLTAKSQFTSTVTTDTSEIIFGKMYDYDVIRFKNIHSTTEEIGNPYLPVKIYNYLVPIDQKIINITVNYTTSQILPDKYYMYPY